MTLVDVIKDSLSDSLAIIVAGGAAMLVAYHKLKTIISGERRMTDSNSASGDIIQLLRSEVARLGVQNAELAKLVDSLQLEVIALRGENREFKQIVEELRYGK